MKALTIATLQPYLSPTFTSSLKSSKFREKAPPKLLQSKLSRRFATTATVLLATESIFSLDAATCFEFRMTVPDQTPEEAMSGIRSHAQQLLDIKPLIESQSWKEAQKALRKSSAYLKQDIYTLIQAKPGKERPHLRKLYSLLFNNVTRLDYAARSKEETLVREYYQNIVGALDDILSRIFSS